MQHLSLQFCLTDPFLHALAKFPLNGLPLIFLLHLVLLHLLRHLGGGVGGGGVGFAVVVVMVVDVEVDVVGMVGTIN